MTLDLSKPVQTRDGRKVRILTTDRKHPQYPLICLIEGTDGKEFMACRTYDGKAPHGGLTEGDLVNIPEREARFLNLYINKDGTIFSGRVFRSLGAAQNVSEPLNPGRAVLGVLRLEVEGDKLIHVGIVGQNGDTV